MRRLARYIIILAPVFLIMTACATTGINLGQFNLISGEEEIQLGKNLSAEIEQQQPVLENPALTRYVNDIGQALAAQSDRRDVPYSFKIIDNDEDVNAFALPGGPVYVYTGLLRLAENEAELAGVLGHETAHIAARHSTEQVTKQFGYSLLAQIILGEDPSATAAIARDIVGSLGTLKFSRNDEIEADRLGVHYMSRAGYNPDAMLSFMKKLGQLQSGSPSRVLNLLSTHPLSQDRLDAIRQEIATLPPSKKGEYYSQRYRDMMRRELR